MIFVTQIGDREDPSMTSLRNGLCPPSPGAHSHPRLD